MKQQLDATEIDTRCALSVLFADWFERFSRVSKMRYLVLGPSVAVMGDGGLSIRELLVSGQGSVEWRFAGC
jgi:hypothetical protein